MHTGHPLELLAASPDVMAQIWPLGLLLLGRDSVSL